MMRMVMCRIGMIPRRMWRRRRRERTSRMMKKRGCGRVFGGSASRSRTRLQEGFFGDEPCY